MRYLLVLTKGSNKDTLSKCIFEGFQLDKSFNSLGAYLGTIDTSDQVTKISLIPGVVLDKEQKSSAVFDEN